MPREGSHPALAQELLRAPGRPRRPPRPPPPAPPPPATPPYPGAPATPSGPAYPGPSSGVPGESAASSAAQRPQDRTVDPVRPVWTEDDPLGLYVDEAPQVRQEQPAPARAPGRRGVKPLAILAAGAAVGIAALAGLPLPAMLATCLAT